MQQQDEHYRNITVYIVTASEVANGKIVNARWRPLCLYERESGKKIAPYYFVMKRSDTKQLKDKQGKQKQRRRPEVIFNGCQWRKGVTV